MIEEKKFSPFFHFTVKKASFVWIDVKIPVTIFFVILPSRQNNENSEVEFSKALRTLISR